MSTPTKWVHSCPKQRAKIELSRGKMGEACVEDLVLDCITDAGERQFKLVRREGLPSAVVFCGATAECDASDRLRILDSNEMGPEKGPRFTFYLSRVCIRLLNTDSPGLRSSLVTYHLSLSVHRFARCAGSGSKIPLSAIQSAIRSGQCCSVFSPDRSPMLKACPPR